MGLRWQATLGCLCVLVTMGLAAVVPTQDTIVVARSDEAITSESTTEFLVTTEEPLLPIKLTEMEVRSEVALRYAHTAVVTRVRNPAKRAQEATFRVLLPETAFISGFTMILDGKSYKAYVKEKEEAKQIYNEAVSQGIGAAHISAKARDSNHFTVAVNVEPNTTAVFNLTYEELLVRRNGVYNHAINLHPGALVPKLTVTVHIKETQNITDLRVPEVRTGNEIDATVNDAQNTKAVIERSSDGREATITFTPDLEEQNKLIEIYREKTKDSLSHSNRWYSSENVEDNKSEGVLGQFVVQYDVDRPKDGEILVNDGYFVHFFAPSSLPPLNKHVVFVLDTSGSMMDRKIVQLREAMQTILSELNKGDYFSIVEFSSSVKVHDLKEADEVEPTTSDNYYPYGGLYLDSDKAPTLVPPSQATPENIAKAKIIVNRLIAGGGTNIASALDVAVDLIQKGIGQKTEVNVTAAPPKENAEANANKETTEVVKQEATSTLAPVDNKAENADGAKKLEPIIIFLTDGDPTVGETDPKRIINRLTEKNYGENKASIFSLAFGEDADRKFLRKLSLRNEGFMRHIYEAADAALQLRDFYRQVSSPLLADVKFVYPPEQVKEGSLTKNKFRTYYAGSETIVAGRVADSSTEITPQVLGFCGVYDGFGRKRFEITPKVPVASNREGYLPLERLWGYLTIKQLLDERDALEDSDQPKDKENGPEKKALDLALKYEFVTPLTSLVVVKPNATNAVDAESVDKLTAVPANIGAFGAPLSASSFAPAAGGLPGPPGYPAFPVYSSQLSPESISVQQTVLQDPIPIFEEAEPEYSLDIDGFTSNQAFRPIFNSTGSSSYSGPYSAQGFRGYPSTPAALPTLSTTRIFNPLEEYLLQDYDWAQSLLNVTADTLVLQVGGTSVYLKLVKDGDAPRASGDDPECSNSTEGAGGVCVYLTRCEAARNITAQIYSNTYCSVKDGYAGVCCPKLSVDQASTTP